MLKIKIMNKRVAEQPNISEYLESVLGYIPDWLSQPESQMLPAAEAINVNYQHGGGWHSFEGFLLSNNGSLRYPGDPILHPIVKYERTYGDREEIIYQYNHGWVAVTDPEHSTLDVSRID
jgi:hypothetical protein